LSGALHVTIERCLTGDQSAMSALVKRFQGQVFGLCYRMLGNRHDAEDAVQETFIRVLRSLRRYDPTREFEPWLLAIAGNRCRTALAARKRRSREQPFWELPVRETAEAHDARQLAEEVARGLQDLRPEYRQAFLMFHDHEMSYEQIANSLGRPIGTVKTWIHRARRELIQHLVQREVVPENRHAVRRI
jgi:RNA polymerase sigma-70 factor (ECF subfamily)